MRFADKLALRNCVDGQQQKSGPLVVVVLVLHVACRHLILAFSVLQPSSGAKKYLTSTFTGPLSSSVTMFASSWSLWTSNFLWHAGNCDTNQHKDDSISIFHTRIFYHVSHAKYHKKHLSQTKY